MERSGPFLMQLRFRRLLPHGRATGLKIRQKLSSLEPILASLFFENAIDVPSPTGS